MMEMSRVSEWVNQHRWWVALVIVIIAGYAIGKDLALRDNQRSADLQSEQGK